MQSHFIDLLLTGYQLKSVTPVPKMKTVKMAYDVYSPNETSKNLPPVILIHCLVETRKTWKHVGPEIAKKTGRKVYAIDCRNHGDSPWTEEYGSEILTSDLDDFFRQNQIQKAIIIGHSMGGVVAMQFALREPMKVEKLIVEDSPARRSEHRPSNFVPFAIDLLKEIYINQPQDKGEDASFEYISYNFRQVAPLLKASPDLFEKYDREMLPFKFNGKILELRFNLDAITSAVVNDKLLRELSGTFEGEALFMFGTESQFKVGQDHVIAKHFPKAIKVGFENVGHFIHHEYPDEFTREVANFINDNKTQKSKL